MKLGIYDIINVPRPKLFKISSVDVSQDEFLTNEGMVGVMNRCCKMQDLSTEHAFALGLTSILYPKGILQCNIGDCKGVEVDDRQLATGLLLMGAERFYMFHNHPGRSREISKEDKALTEKLRLLGALIGIELDEHIMITKGYWAYCNEQNKAIPFS